jgi:cholesterol oxidase
MTIDDNPARRGISAADTVQRTRRPLRVAGPEVHHFETSDGLRLRLTRYKGGDKGPVILSHGLGVSSLLFSIDTIETNLLEYLFAHGFDVWLLDYRASIEIPTSSAPFTADDVATRDYPAAVARVLRESGAESVQVVAHCFGSTTFTMAMLAGLKGVRSAVCSQIAAHIVAPLPTRIKAGLYVPIFMNALGLDTFDANADPEPHWTDRVYDNALGKYLTEHEERCDSPVCPRINFIYGHLFEHDQLNDATHAALDELFGVAGVKTLDHLARLVRTGHLVAFDGEEDYMPNLERLGIPITFIHGAENQCYLPESTERTYNLLCEMHGAQLYNRHVIPNYGHLDCIFGQHAARDVYPLILKHLTAT